MYIVESSTYITHILHKEVPCNKIQEYFNRIVKDINTWMDKKVDFYFRHVPAHIRSQLILDHEASYSVTDQVTADKITKDIRLFVDDSNAVITDGTACVGGNTYSFAKSFVKVNAIEIDPLRHSYLKHNMSILGLSNVVCSSGDITEQYKKQYQDVIFLDPPWGGPDYKQQQDIQLYLSQKELADVCIDMSLYCKYIALKVPTNFNVDTLDERVKDVMERVHYNDTLRKMCLAIYKCLHNNTTENLFHLI